MAGEVDGSELDVRDLDADGVIVAVQLSADQAMREPSGTTPCVRAEGCRVHLADRSSRL